MSSLSFISLSAFTDVISQILEIFPLKGHGGESCGDATCSGVCSKKENGI